MESLKIKEAKALKNNLRKRNIQKMLRENSAPVSKLVIQGGIPLHGSITISGAKNSALPIILSSILTEKEVTINNIPNLSDVLTSNEILTELGAELTFNNNTIHINPSTIKNHKASYDLVSTMRASVLILGPLLAKFGEAYIPLPGGCSIGSRPIDLHLKAFAKMGATITQENGYIIAKCDKLKGADIYMEKASVGATENVIMGAVLADGITTIVNGAKEPEIIDLANFLNSMGAKVKGAGTDNIVIEGVTSLHGTTYSVCPDRIEAGSYLIAAAITKGEITLNNINPLDLFNIIEPLKLSGSKIETLGGTSIKISGGEKINPVDIVTSPYPGFPTDMQPQWTTLMTLSSGKSVITESIFENRFLFINELIRMGANITQQNPNTIIVNGVEKLSATDVRSTDLRASFSLILAGLSSSGTTTINKLHHLDRGYENVEEKLGSLGAKINRLTV